MSRFKPLVLDPTAETPVRQLQGNAELDIPLEDRFQTLNQKYKSLVIFLLSEGFELPDESIGEDIWT